MDRRFTFISEDCCLSLNNNLSTTYLQGWAWSGVEPATSNFTNQCASYWNSLSNWRNGRLFLFNVGLITMMPVAAETMKEKKGSSILDTIDDKYKRKLDSSIFHKSL